MKIKCNKTNIGITVNIYIPNTELKTKQTFLDVCNSGKDYRVKRSFDINFSQKALEATEKVLSNLLNNLNDYLAFYQGIGPKGLAERIEKEMQSELNDYQLSKIPEIIDDIAIPIFLNQTSQKDIASIRNKYNLTERDMLVTFVGNFGYGKTTTIKKLLNFDEDFRFLLVDNGRTTIFNTVIKGLVVQNDQIGNIPVKEFLFQNRIELHEKEDVYQNIVVNALDQAFIQYTKTPTDTLSILRVFNRDTTCPLDGLFGTIDENATGFYEKILAEFQKYSVEDIPDFSTNENELKTEFFDFFERILQERISTLQESFPQIAFKMDNHTISFALTLDQIEKHIDDIYQYFTDNMIKGGSLRICVKEIYLETNFAVNGFQKRIASGQLKNLDFPTALFHENTNHLKYQSFVFMDTVGCGHTQKTPSEADDKMDSDLLHNRGILRESDIIILLDKATETMDVAVKHQLYTLESLGLKEKILLAYTHYNQFIKTDMQVDKDREDQLDVHLERALKSLYPNTTSDKAMRYYNHLNEELEESCLEYLIENQRKKHIIYLKGLVERKNVQSESNPTVETKASRRSKETKIKTENQEDQIAKKLNEGIEYSEQCLVELIDKIVLLHEEYQSKKSQTFSVIAHHNEDNFKMKYIDNVYQTVPKMYLQKEQFIYKINTPEYNTTKALCRNAGNGNPYFNGTTRILKPLEDLQGILQPQISEFLDSTKNQFLELENEELDKDLKIEFLTDEIKQQFSKQSFDYLSKIIVAGYKTIWKNLENDSGSGVKKRRANGIYNLLESVVSMEEVNWMILTILTNCIDNIIEAYTVKVQ